jgi:hypothetical protein
MNCHQSPEPATVPANNSLQLTRLACGKLRRSWPAKLRENEWPVARAAGQLSSRPLGISAPRRPILYSVLAKHMEPP